jgi:hypothetical protein
MKKQASERVGTMVEAGKAVARVELAKGLTYVTDIRNCSEYTSGVRD